MILYRCFAWNESASASEPGGASHAARALQGAGRHDSPDAYGCLYASADLVSAVSEQFARFRGRPLNASLLRRWGLPLALASLEISGNVELVDLDDPRVLTREQLRPSRVATGVRDVTQPQARALYERYPSVGGLRWWSTIEASWTNVTLFDRAIPSVQVREVRVLTLEDPAVVEAAHVLGLA